MAWMLLLTLQRYTWLWAAARGGQEDRKEQGPRRGTVAASFHVCFPLKLSFNVSITLFFQKINIGIEKKNRSPKSECQQISSGKFGSVLSPFSTNSDFIPEEIIIGKIMFVECTQC